MMGVLWCSREESTDHVVPTPDATHGNSLHSTAAADNMPEFPTHSTANQTPALANTVPSLHSACDSPLLVSFKVEKRSRLTNLSRMAFIGRKRKFGTVSTIPQEDPSGLVSWVKSRKWNAFKSVQKEAITLFAIDPNSELFDGLPTVTEGQLNLKF